MKKQGKKATKSRKIANAPRMGGKKNLAAETFRPKYGKNEVNLSEVNHLGPPVSSHLNRLRSINVLKNRHHTTDSAVHGSFPSRDNDRPLNMNHRKPIGLNII